MNVEQRWRWHWNINIRLYFYQQRIWCEQDVLLAQRNRKSWKSSSTRINHFKSCKTSLFLLFPFYSALSASLRGNRLGNCKNPTQIPPSPTSDKSYLNCSHFSRSQQTTVSGLFEKKGKKEQVSSLCGAVEQYVTPPLPWNNDHNQDIFQVREGHTLLRCLHAHVAGRPNRIIIITSARVKTSNILAATSGGLLIISGHKRSIALEWISSEVW